MTNISLCVEVMDEPKFGFSVCDGDINNEILNFEFDIESNKLKKNNWFVKKFYEKFYNEIIKLDDNSSRIIENDFIDSYIKSFYITDDKNYIEEADDQNNEQNNKEKEEENKIKKIFFVFMGIHGLIYIFKDEYIQIDNCKYRIETDLIMYYKRLRIEFLKMLLVYGKEFYISNIKINFNEDFKMDILDIIGEWMQIFETNDDKLNQFFIKDSEFINCEIKLSKSEGEPKIERTIEIKVPFSREEGFNSLLFINNNIVKNMVYEISIISNEMANHLINWYLKIYDFKTANEIEKNLNYSGNIYKRSIRNPELNIKENTEWYNLDNSNTSKIKKFISNVYDFVPIMLFFLVVYFECEGLSIEFINLKMKNIIYVGFISVVVTFISFYSLRKFWISVKVNVKTYNLLIPRLAGAIIIGYIPLIWTYEIMEFAVKINYILVSIIIIIALVISFIYVYIEVTNSLEFNISKKVALKRTIKIVNIGVFQSMIIGFLLMNFFSIIFKTAIEKLENINVGMMIYKIYIFEGAFYSKVFILYVPMALVLGLLLQILWEDKQITHPL